MSDKEKRILQTFARIIPKMTDMQQERLLAFGEGMEFKTQLEEKEKAQRELCEA